MAEAIQSPESTDNIDDSERIYTAGQWHLAWRKFKQNKLALISGGILGIMYLCTLLSGFIAPYEADHRFGGRDFVSPQSIRFFSDEGFHFRPFVYGLTIAFDPLSGRKIYQEDHNRRYPIYLFETGDTHSFLGFNTQLHLFGIRGQNTEGIFIFGTDRQGRDLFSRVFYGARVSLTIGLIGVFISIILGSVLGVVSGYFGGWIDELLQRLIEILRAFPQIPLWMALSAAIPADIDQLKTYFLITLILSFLGWTSLARQIRGRMLSLRNEEFVISALLMGASHTRIIFRHLIPAVLGHIIVIGTIAVPQMILAESALSFLNLGIRPPMTSWGVLLQDGRSLTTLYYYQWLLIPASFIVVAVLCFNFLGDGLRDAVDPYSK
ncbi:MAG: ABC transporter permease [Candidatus Latescibacteria bacterium]|jgi:peptide/nickel transport system permease protein|nr:ABC transporter permease [Candidatus Latescibacterota bacterium]MBT4136859.1 ABC transporter permease [Candidatus Latescibacterota bacterium]